MKPTIDLYGSSILTGLVGLVSVVSLAAAAMAELVAAVMNVVNWIGRHIPGAATIHDLVTMQGRTEGADAAGVLSLNARASEMARRHSEFADEVLAPTATWNGRTLSAPGRSTDVRGSGRTTASRGAPPSSRRGPPSSLGHDTRSGGCPGCTPCARCRRSRRASPRPRSEGRTRLLGG